RTPDAEGMLGAIAKAREIAGKIPGSFIALQFENTANPEYHFETTAEEIYEQMQGQVDALVIGIGTGGTFSGIARLLKQRNPKVLSVAVETQGSILQGKPPGPHKVEGIGVSFIPKTFERNLCDEIIMVSDDDAFATVRELAREEGVLGGSSAGANVYAALQVAKRLGSGKRVVTIIPDAAERYLSKNIFSGGA
ncbi:MAG: cysteine synthase family protein, partial [Acidobacteria bacterium]|nr:cysteine synthase family protein [Acidobacteriota bacterium]